jgi:hypothetical protein
MAKITNGLCEPTHSTRDHLNSEMILGISDGHIKTMTGSRVSNVTF